MRTPSRSLILMATTMLSVSFGGRALADDTEAKIAALAKQMRAQEIQLDHMRRELSERAQQMRALQANLIRLHKALFLDASPGPTKFALTHLGLCEEDARLPITACDAAHHAEILAAMDEAGVTA